MAPHYGQILKIVKARFLNQIMCIFKLIGPKGSIMKVVNFSWSSFHKKFDRNFAFGTIGPYSSILE